mmetsp:Transcript_16926/g.14825  ORF Transcript_16926/g.14825 Transcript_16926/m.14825 type:complete len:204 (-) Transcript_16926:425-1036(-)
MGDITNSKDVGVGGGFSFINNNLFALGVNFNSSLLKFEAREIGLSADSEENSIESIGESLTSFSVLPGDLLLAIFLFFDGGQDTFIEELGSVLFHVFANLLSHILIESSQQDGSDQDSSVITNAGKETSAFQSDVRGTNNQSLAGVGLQGEDIIRSNAVLFSAGNIIGDDGSSTSGDNVFLGFDILSFILDRVVQFEGLLVLE